MTSIEKAKKQSVALTDSQLSVKDTIRGDKFLESVKNVLPEGSLTARKYISTCLTAISVNPKLLQCKPTEIYKAMLESARYGLEPNSPLSEAALIPYGDKCNFVIEYRGLMKLAWNTGLLKSLDFDKVCDSDEFEYKKSQNGIVFKHTPNLKGERTDAYAYYAIAELNSGGVAFQVMSKSDILKHAQQFSKGFSSKSSPWQTDFDSMAFKTVIRQLCDKKLPKSTTDVGYAKLMREAAHIDDFVDVDENGVIIENNDSINDVTNIN